MSRPGLARVMRDHEDSVRCLALSPDGRDLASGSDDSCVRVWDMTPSESVVAVAGFGGPVTAIAYSPDALHLAAASADSSVRVVHAKPGRDFGQTVWVWRGNTENISTGVNALDWAPDATMIAVAAADTIFAFKGDFKAGDLGEPLAKINAPSVRHDLAFSPDAKRIAYAVTVRRGPVSKADRERQASPRKRRASRGSTDLDAPSPHKQQQQQQQQASANPSPSPKKGAGPWPLVFVDAPKPPPPRQSPQRRASFQRD